MKRFILFFIAFLMLLLSACDDKEKNINKELIMSFITQHEEDLFGEDYYSYDSFEISEKGKEFRKFNAHLYTCEWSISEKDKKIQREFIVKGTNIIPINPLRGKYNLDFDNDGENELILYSNEGSGLSYDSFYVLEKDEDIIYQIGYVSLSTGPIIPAKAQKGNCYTVEIFLMAREKRESFYIWKKMGTKVYILSLITMM